MKTAHIWNSLANMHACNPPSLTSSFRKQKKPTPSSCQDASGFPWGQNQNQAPSLTPQTLMCKSNTHSVLTPANKIKLGRQTEKKCFAFEVDRTQVDHAICNYFALQTGSKRVTCPYTHSFHWRVGGGRRIRWPLYFRATWEGVRVWKLLLLLTVGAIQCK